jgi:Tfp pilus assembly PilM family ATPase
MILISENQGKHIAKIILTGGGSRYQAFTELFASIGPAVEIGNPLSRVAYDPQSQSVLEQAAGQLAIAIGLALRTAQTN